VNPPYETDAYRGVPADPSGGPYPLVLFSHGFAGFRLTTTFLTTHLASWGFVVIAPDYLERGLASVLGDPVPSPRSDRVVADEAITAAAEANDEAGGPLEGIIDSSEVFPIGHSAGGGTSLRLLTRPDVNTAIPMASGISEISLIQGNAPVLPPNAAITFIAGRADGIADVANARTGYEYTPGPGRLVELDRAGHNNAFTELCEIGDGGVAAIARSTGLPIPGNLLALGDDGCPTPPFAPSPEVWDEVRHFVTAELRFRAGLDADTVGLGDGIVAAFDDVLTYRHDP
jgi:dienelactone hydrolase